jgi:hypothetical protein
MLFAIHLLEHVFAIAADFPMPTSQIGASDTNVSVDRSIITGHLLGTFSQIAGNILRLAPRLRRPRISNLSLTFIFSTSFDVRHFFSFLHI